VSKNINILWFRKDLRLNDNPALVKANLNSEILPIYIYWILVILMKAKWDQLVKYGYIIL